MRTLSLVDPVGIDPASLKGNPLLLGNELAGGLGVIPVESESRGCLLLVTDREITIREYSRLRFLVRREFRLIKTDPAAFRSLFEKTWPESAGGSAPGACQQEDFKARIVREGGASDPDSARERAVLPGTEATAGSAIEIVDELFSRAIKVGASDIHLEPAEGSVRIRFRLDGVLHTIMTIPKAQQNEVISRLKILSRMDIAEKRRPQDGRIVVEGRSKSIDIRVSSMPTIHGEKMVLRLLDKSIQKLELTFLGMKGDNYTVFKKAITRPHGMILVTGPTGSGKTTTLYSALKEIHTPEINISTVEDPIEYQLDGINQTQYNPAIEYTFAAAVKTFLRQDPDVIMIGEIRDPETAKYAIQASQTGHLVFSTLHTNDAPGAIVRLLEMGMEPYLVASTLSLVIAQRLVRCSCKHCGVYRPPTPKEREFLKRAGSMTERVFAGTGCKDCIYSGYRGRSGVFEMMQVTPEVQELVSEKAPTSKIKEKALEQGMVTLSRAAIKLVDEGITTVEEVESAIG